ncbi:Eco57I restriction-modification methylase domain-containing protein [Pseudorhodoplanes sp.]|uniref:Eco57I restriction-modification methylase domain-containing protein n=1 Tax=Pseudorhodoplanes sp. TaxID=1934341 RepID=UPI00391B1967
MVFGEVFPDLIRALKSADPQAPAPLTADYLATLRDAALTMLYRLLFLLYAEDRDLLPKRDPKYGGLSDLRDKVAERLDAGTDLSRLRKNFGLECNEVFVTIDQGDDSIGVPPYNGGLFSEKNAATALLDRAILPDAYFAPLLDRLSRTDKDGRRVRINFRDLSVQQLGSIYERLLEYEPVANESAPGGIEIRLNSFARKGSGSYYTPDELVKLIIERTIGPLVRERLDAFAEKAKALASDKQRVELRLQALRKIDPAERILDLKIVDPAMGSGHFLVSLVDYLAEAVTAAMGEASEAVTWGDYVSPLDNRLNDIRKRIRAEADAHKWVVRDDQLVNKNLIKRTILKRCVYGVDKNPMAVELAKVALWLHTFTAGAPLSLLDHHLKCGDSLFGEWVRKALDGLAARGSLMISGAIQAAEAAIAGMALIESRSDADIAEVKASAADYHDVTARTEPLRRFLDFWQAVKWLDLTDDEKKALDAALDGAFGPPTAVLAGLQEPVRPAGLTDEALSLFDEGREEQLAITGLGSAGTARDFRVIGGLIARAHALAAEQHFLHWQIAFPGVWKNWASADPDGGFDAVIGNPPWDQVDFEHIKWFENRDPAVSRSSTDSERKRLIRAHQTSETQLWAEFQVADAVFDTQLKRSKSEYSLFRGRKFFIHFAFVEQSLRLINSFGKIGLLVPLGVVSHNTSSKFVERIVSRNLLREVIDFENRMGLHGSFFPDIDARTKFCILVMGRSHDAKATFASFFTDIRIPVEKQLLSLSREDISAISPNSGLLPIAQSKRALALTRAAYSKNPVMFSRSHDKRELPLLYRQLFNRATDSNLFVDIEQLQQMHAFPIGYSRFKFGGELYYPVYEGKMVGMFNHRASSVVRNTENLYRKGQPARASETELTDPQWSPLPDYWIADSQIETRSSAHWMLGIKDVTSVTNERTVIASFLPRCAPTHTIPVLLTTNIELACLGVGNLNSFCLDFFARQKVQTNHLSEYILDELAIVSVERMHHRRFGKRTAADIVKDHVLRLTYTAHDMAPFARDMGYINADGTVKPPVIWNETERRHLRARLDALYFILYGVTGEDDIRYILSTFPIVERKDRQAHEGVYLTRELILWYKRALEAGDTETDAPEAEVIRLAKARGD